MKKLTETQEALLSLTLKWGGCLTFGTLPYVCAGTVKALERRGLIELRACNYYVTEAGVAYAEAHKLPA